MAWADRVAQEEREGAVPVPVVDEVDQRELGSPTPSQPLLG